MTGDMDLEDWIGCSDDGLVQDAQRIAARLAAPSEGSMVALAFGRDRRAFAASLLACWLRGHGAAVVENALRERIMAVLAHPSVVDLLHDTDSGRPLQVPRLLAGPDEACAAFEPAKELPSPMLAVHVQTEDGDQRWCSWTPDELSAAVEATTRAELRRLDAAPGVALVGERRATQGLKEHRPREAGRGAEDRQEGRGQFCSG